MYYFVALIIYCLATACGSPTVTLEDDLFYEDRPHFKIVTENAVYYLDKAGGGFSRIIDRDGNDWVAWHPEPSEYPPSGAGNSRGLPNYTNGPGHPGYDDCTSEIVFSTPDSIKIRSVSTDGEWDFSWTFYANTAVNHVVSIPENYWFLYEGPIGGRFAPKEQYWGNDTEGYLTSTPDYVGGIIVNGSWQWTYFGDNQLPRIFFMAMRALYSDKSMFGYLGSEGTLDSKDGMIVCGFGRLNYPDKFISGGDKEFIIGFLEKKVTDTASHAVVAESINGLIEN
jgi:hypothetical protein